MAGPESRDNYISPSLGYQEKVIKGEAVGLLRIWFVLAIADMGDDFVQNMRYIRPRRWT
jgi:hypothetical protein